MHKIRTAVPVLAAGAALIVAAAPSAVAAGSESVPASAAAAPAGASFQQAQYTPQNQGSAAVHPADYPTGCGLTVLSYQSGLDAVGSASTSCPFNVDRIQQTVNIARSRWYGWEDLANNTNGENVTTSHGTTVDWYCGGKGTYTYRVVGRGLINSGGQTWNAAAYDEARYAC